MRTECDTCTHRKTRRKYCKKDSTMKVDKSDMFDMCLMRVPDWTVKNNFISTQPIIIIDKNSEDFDKEPDFTKFLIKGGIFNMSKQVINLKDGTNLKFGGCR